MSTDDDVSEEELEEVTLRREETIWLKQILQ